MITNCHSHLRLHLRSLFWLLFISLVCSDFNGKCSPSGSLFEHRVPHLRVLFWEAVESLAIRNFLVDMSHSRWTLRVIYIGLSSLCQGSCKLSNTSTPALQEWSAFPESWVKIKLSLCSFCKVSCHYVKTKQKSKQQQTEHIAAWMVDVTKMTYQCVWLPQDSGMVWPYYLNAVL